MNGTPDIAAKARQRDGIGGALGGARRVQGTGRLRILGALRVSGADFLKMPGMSIRRVFSLVTGRRGFCKPS
ncbi:MAG: hypothetical protein LBG06_08435 [Deltaproteobacteria bacterium]|nr:hypothetical protein [Deltaproteobacteria bacterium]